MQTKIDITLEHIIFLARHFKTHETRYMATTILMELDVPTKYDGFAYLVTAICLSCEDPIGVVVNGLYPSVADYYGGRIGEKQIEQSIRVALRAAWKQHDPAVWDFYFGRKGSLSKPSNAEFISRLARFVEMWKGCCGGHDSSKEGAV